MSAARRFSQICVGAVVVLAVAACVNETREPLLVSAAASLANAFAAIEQAFEADNPGIDVELNFGGSSALREQIRAGAAVDVFASADAEIMNELVRDGVATTPVVFATNHMAIAVPAGNPAGVDGLETFAEEQLLIGLCAQPVPCGSFARHVLANAGITPSIDTAEPNVRALLTKIELGELDAGIVYASDVTAAAGAVGRVPIPSEVDVSTLYPAAVLSDAAAPESAELFVSYLLTAPAQARLRDTGFGRP